MPSWETAGASRCTPGDGTQTGATLRRSGDPPVALQETRKPPPKRGFPCGGRYWDRTSDLFRVREARYRCANRPGECGAGGGDGIRTRVDGFAGRCLASRPPHHRGSRLREYPNGGIPSGESWSSADSHTRADDEIRTRDPHLGKVMRYHCATSAFRSGPKPASVSPLSRRREELYTNRTASAKILPVHRACPPCSCGTGPVRRHPMPLDGAATVEPGAPTRRHLLHRPPTSARGAHRCASKTYRLARDRPRHTRAAARVRHTLQRPLLSTGTQVQGAIGAVGSALRSHRRGHQFESGIAHVSI